MQKIPSFDTNFKFVTILGITYEIIDSKTVRAVDAHDKFDIVEYYKFNWANIPSIEYKKTLN